MKKILQRNVGTELETQKFVVDFLHDFLRKEDNFTIFFRGGLGAGKTFIIRELLRLFGVKDKISSPTYVYVNEYDANDRSFAHFDLYRFEEPEMFFTKGFDEIADDNSVSCFVEWEEKITPETHRIFSGKKFIIEIRHGNSVGLRKIKVYRDE